VKLRFGIRAESHLQHPSFCSLALGCNSWCALVSPAGGRSVPKSCLLGGEGTLVTPSVFPRCSEEVKTPGEEVSKAKVHYNVEFTFDTDARVAITIYYQASEEFHNGVAR